MGDVLWIFPALGCGLMMAAMVVMMLPMMKGMFSRDQGEEASSVEELRAEQARMAEEIEQLKAREREESYVES